MAKQELLTEDDDVKDKTEREEIVIVEEKPEQVKKPDPKADEHDEDDEEDERPSSRDDDVNPDDPDNKERDAIRERRRLEKIERKERRDKAISRDKLEMDFLRKRNDDLEKRFTTLEQRQHTADLSSVDRALKETLNEVDMAEKVIAKAVEAGNGADVTQAMRYRDQAMAKAQQLQAAKQQASKQPTGQTESLDNMTMHYAKEFVNEHKWYDPNGRDEDSAVVLAIDQGLVRDGFDPRSEDYWAELRKRAARRMPERFTTAKEAPEVEKRESRGGPAIGSGREHAPSSTRREVYISPDRKQALMDAGVWDDPVLRMKYVKRYAEYDKTNRA